MISGRQGDEDGEELVELSLAGFLPDDDDEPPPRVREVEVDESALGLGPPPGFGEVDPEAPELGDGQLAYELHEWSGESRGLLGSLLGSAEVAHVWHGTRLVVREADEDEVDALVEEVRASAGRSLDLDADKVVYEVGEWPASLQAELADLLGAEGIPYEWDQSGDLVVYADDEERVEGLIEALPDPDDERSDDGLAVQSALTEMWGAADRLARDPRDPTGVLAAVESAGTLEHLALPFGFTAPVWRHLVSRAGAVRDLLESDHATDDDVSAAAAEVRDLLRDRI